MVLRRRPIANGKEALIAVCAVGIPAAVSFSLLSNRFENTLLWFAALWVAYALLPISWPAYFRWRSRIVVDSEAVEYYRSGKRPQVRMEWAEVREVFILGPRQFKVRGTAGAICLTKDYADHEAGARIFWERSREAIDGRLRTAYREAGMATFPAPWPALGAHALYLIMVLMLTSYTTYLVWNAWRAWQTHWPLWSLLGGSIWLYWLWEARKGVSWMGGGVTLRPSGLTVRRLDGERRIGWEDVQGANWSKKGGLEVRMFSRKRLIIPHTIGNLEFLRRMIEERLGRGPNNQGTESVPC